MSQSRTSLTKWAPAMRDPREVDAPDVRRKAAAAWCERGYLCVAADDPRLDDWERAKVVALGVRLYGERRT